MKGNRDMKTMKTKIHSQSGFLGNAFGLFRAAIAGLTAEREQKESTCFTL